MTHNRSASAKTSLVSDDVIARCEKAVNCEIFTTDNGKTNIRFTKGTEPGTDKYKQLLVDHRRLHKRDDQVTTHVTIGSNTLNYGPNGASGEPGAFNNLWDVCGESSCDPTPTPEDGSAYDTDKTLTMHASGQYNGWGDQQGFIKAIVAASSNGEQCWDQWIPCGNSDCSEGDEMHQCKQTNFIGVNRFQGTNGPMLGFMQVLFDYEGGSDDEDSGACDTILGLGGAFVGSMEGAAGAAFFGAILPLTCALM